MTEATRFRVLTGITYPENPSDDRASWRMKRAEAGETVTDIPERSRPWLLRKKAIEPVRDEPPVAAADEEADTDG